LAHLSNHAKIGKKSERKKQSVHFLSGNETFPQPRNIFVQKYNITAFSHQKRMSFLFFSYFCILNSVGT